MIAQNIEFAGTLSGFYELCFAKYSEIYGKKIFLENSACDSKPALLVSNLSYESLCYIIPIQLSLFRFLS